MTPSTESSTPVDNVAVLLREIVRLKKENARLYRRTLHLEQSRDHWRERSLQQRSPLSRSDPRHGTVNGYSNLRCRCAKCRTAWRNYCRERDHRVGRHRPQAVVNEERRTEALARENHGTEHRYTNMGCRCDACKAASAAARKRRRRRDPETIEYYRAYDRERRRKKRAA